MNTITNSFEVGVQRMTLSFNRLTKVLFGIIGILLISLFITIGSWSSTQENLNRKTDTLNWLAHEYKKVSDTVDNQKAYDFFLFITSLSQKRDPEFIEIASIVFKKATEYQVDPYLIMSIIDKESGFNRIAQTYCAFGLMQVNYNAWKDDLNIDFRRLFESEYNISLGIQIFKIYLQEAKGDIETALLYYNNGTQLHPDRTNWQYPAVVLASRYMLMGIGKQ